MYILLIATKKTKDKIYLILSKIVNLNKNTKTTYMATIIIISIINNIVIMKKISI